MEIDRLKKKKQREIFAKEEIKGNTQKAKEASDKLKRDITPMFDYYKSWDKFTKEAVDKASDSEEDEGDADFIPAKQATAVDEKKP